MPPFQILVKGKGKLVARYRGIDIHNGDICVLETGERIKILKCFPQTRTFVVENLRSLTCSERASYFIGEGVELIG